MTAYQCPGYSATVTDGEGVRKSYEFSSKSGINVLEAVNLLQGRTVLKGTEWVQGLSEGTWMQLERVEGNVELVRLGLGNEYNLKQVLIEYARELELFRMTGSAVQRSLEQGNLVSLDMPGSGTFQLSADAIRGGLRFFKDQ